MYMLITSALSTCESLRNTNKLVVNIEVTYCFCLTPYRLTFVSYMKTDLILNSFTLS